MPYGGKQMVSEDEKWLLSPCWRDPSTNLVSLQLHVDSLFLTKPDLIHAIKTIVECHASLELLRVTAQSLGSTGLPFTLPTLSYKGPGSSIEDGNHYKEWVLAPLVQHMAFRQKLGFEHMGPFASWHPS